MGELPEQAEQEAMAQGKSPEYFSMMYGMNML